VPLLLDGVINRPFPGQDVARSGLRRGVHCRSAQAIPLAIRTIPALHRVL